MLTIKNGTASSCGQPEPTKDETLLIVTAFVISLQTIFFALRMLCRAVRIAPWGWDDTSIVVAFALTTSFAGAAVLERRFGFGQNIWTVPPDNIDLFLKVFFSYEAIYVLALGIIKISICFLYLRIFPSRRFRVAVWATQVFNVLLVIGFIVADGFQCRPISYFWQGWDGEHEGHCVDLEAFVYSHAAFNIALDVWMLALPASQVWQLNLSMKKKAEITSMFGFGILLTLVSIIRFVSLKNFAKSKNPTMDFFRVGIWTAVEITAGLMVACMPAARLFVVYMISHATTTTRSYLTSARTGNSNSNGGPPAAKTLSRGFSKASRKRFCAKDLDKNRDYSMSVTVTSNKNFLTSTSDDLHLAEEGSAGIDLQEPSGSSKSSPSRECFGLSDRSSITLSERHKERSKGILVTQD
ncbi:hypothetical protein N0V82_007887 [Gnomoniopsis sp. IMI 355080]|nr:hypothetical protein N0V82_007887 [Gnomoniopsis sp. IMI 355080]